MDEETRLQVLREFAVLDTPAERSYDEIVELAAAICDVPIALISLVDENRQWWKARLGLEAQQTDREVAFCAHAIAGAEPFIVTDAEADPGFASNPLVVGNPHMRFYAGVPLITEEGAAIGTLCVIDRQPRHLAAAQIRALQVLARQVMLHLEYRRKVARLSADTLDREQLERVRHDESELARLIVEQSGDGIVVADETGRICMFNPAAERQHGVGKHEVTALSWAATYGLETIGGAPLPVAETPLYLALHGESVEDARWCVRRPDGSLRLLMGSAWPLTHADGRPRGGLLISRDVTDAARAEEALRVSEERARALYEAERAAREQAEAARRVRDELLSVVSHDLRNPLNAIVTSASMLRRRAEASGHDARHAEVILRASEQMNRLIGDLLDIGAIEAGQLSLRAEATTVQSIVSDFVGVMAPVAAAKTLQLETNLGADEITISVDRQRISQVLSNLVGNALKFTPAGGVVRISARAVDGRVRFSVADTGPGIEPALVPHVFDRFWRADRAARTGVGLGLSIAKGIVEAHRGRIWVDSKPGEGATFSFELPRG